MNTANAPSATEVKRLPPADFLLRKAASGLLGCQVPGGEACSGVSAVLLFPVSYPRQFVSLRYVDAADKEQELGVIEDMDALAPEQQALVQESLNKQYHEPRVLRIIRVRQEFGQLFFKVETQRGVEDFVMPWRQDRAEDWGTNGKVLLDSLNNRYLIPDVDLLSPMEKRLFKTHVYW
jgi:hypothetical protein